MMPIDTRIGDWRGENYTYTCACVCKCAMVILSVFISTISNKSCRNCARSLDVMRDQWTIQTIPGETMKDDNNGELVLKRDKITCTNWTQNWVMQSYWVEIPFSIELEILPTMCLCVWLRRPISLRCNTCLQGGAVRVMSYILYLFQSKPMSCKAISSIYRNKHMHHAINPFNYSET